MATSDLSDSPTASSAGALVTTRARGAATGLVPPPPGQVRPAHDDLPTAPAGQAPPEEPLVREPVDEPVFERSRPAAGEVPGAVEDEGRGTPLQALAGWGGALVLGAACWAGVLAVVGRAV